MNQRFQTQSTCGATLTSLLVAHADADSLVLAVSNAGVDLAADVARGLGAATDVLGVRPIKLPCDGRAVIGAVAGDGTCVVENSLIELLNLDSDACQALVLGAQAEADAAERASRNGQLPASVGGRTVIVVEPRITTSSALCAACLSLKFRGAGRIIVAAPLVSARAVDELESIGAEVLAARVTDEATPSHESLLGPTAGYDARDAGRRWLQDEPPRA